MSQQNYENKLFFPQQQLRLSFCIMDLFNLFHKSYKPYYHVPFLNATILWPYIGWRSIVWYFFGIFQKHSAAIYHRAILSIITSLVLTCEVCLPTAPEGQLEGAGISISAQNYFNKNCYWIPELILENYDWNYYCY